jgi:hypothetical protein
MEIDGHVGRVGKVKYVHNISVVRPELTEYRRRVELLTVKCIRLVQI